MSRRTVETQARLIAALAETMTDNLWASEILTRCGQIKAALGEIIREAESRTGGER